MLLKCIYFKTDIFVAFQIYKIILLEIAKIKRQFAVYSIARLCHIGQGFLKFSLIQLNLSITATQRRIKKWLLWVGDLYMEGQILTSHFNFFIYTKCFRLEGIFKNIQTMDCYHNIC